MRKNCFSLFGIVLVVLLFVSACVKEETETIEHGVPAPTIYASQEDTPDTRSSITVNSEGVGKILWSPADEISVFYGASTGVLYTSTNTEPAAEAAFTTTAIIGSNEGASSNIWGLYPYNSSAVCDGSSVTTTLPATQYGVPGTFDDDLFVTIAHSTSTNLHFFNVCGGIKFSLSRDDITAITFAGNNDEDLAGDISVSFVDDLPSVSVINGQKTITLTPKDGGTFAKNTYYYIVVLPQTLSGGFTMTFETETQLGTFNYTDKAITLKRSVFGKKDEIDGYANFVEKPQPSNLILYTTNDSHIVEFTGMRSVANFGSTIVSNVYENGVGTITFSSSVTKVGYYSFYEADNLVSISLPPSTTDIGVLAFVSCDALESITIPSSVTNIDESAFSQCESLSSVTLSEGLKTIGSMAFTSTNLSSIIVPSSVTSLGSFCFDDNFDHVTVLATTPPSLGGRGVFSENYTYPIYVPASSVEAYKAAQNWSEYADRIQAIPAPIPTPEAVDLGLSVKWASFNLGAFKPEEYGNYYAWGEIMPKDDYSWETYKWCNGSEYTLTKYNYEERNGALDNKMILDLDDDAANVSLGGSWRMPTLAEAQELLNNCTSVWTTESGVNGCRFTSNIEGYKDKSIFLPYSGFYWTSSLHTVFPDRAYMLVASSQNATYGFNERYIGQSIRPVCP